ncbi:chondroitin AC lyase [Coprinopsis marcescibilis]|uniref:Chondroitin AC lyase n=1 Tax=Coprinopsis marcescibilis TaxID=230819 RepID=A0A5C3LCV6_COPMA|nr:chondroitin AC lyase [Coprinopsis marcescibilis]
MAGLFVLVGLTLSLLLLSFLFPLLSSLSHRVVFDFAREQDRLWYSELSNIVEHDKSLSDNSGGSRLSPRQALSDLTTIHQRRLSSIIGEVGSPGNISRWISSLDVAGKWPDSEIDYTTGCAARRANWPAQVHWQRILIMSGAWHGGLAGGERWVRNESLRQATRLAMNYWFQRDIRTLDCLDRGGTTRCPCDDADITFWNTNWFSNIILIPELVGQSCLLLGNSLSASEAASCIRITFRSFNTFGRSINGVGYLTGANTLDVARIGIDHGLLSSNASIVNEAYRRTHDELVVQNDTKADGIRLDGSFGQHAGILYNGNYGDSNAVLDVELIASGTQFGAQETGRLAFDRLIEGHAWMIFADSLTQSLHFDLSALGRFITFPVADNQATGGIHMNLTKVRELGRLWPSKALTDFADSLLGRARSANAGSLLGNKVFYTNDYVVHRGESYVTSLRMFSNRTANTECVNSQNPLGLHLSDGTLYKYIRGDEYEDIAAAWDWNLIPGITTDYRNAPLNCTGAGVTGVESFVGGASDSQVGVAAMQFISPLTRSLRWQKTWFFLKDDVQHVMVNILTSNSKAPLYSVLDQRRRFGPTIVNGEPVSGAVTMYQNPQQLWHADIGYVFPNYGNDSAVLNLQLEEKTGNWSSIGTSTQPPTKVELWAGWLQHTTTTKPIEYTTFLGVSYSDFSRKFSQPQPRIRTVSNNEAVTAIFDTQTSIAMAVYWRKTASLTVTPGPTSAPITITVSGEVIMIFSFMTGKIVVSDPSQTLSKVDLTLAIGDGSRPSFWTGDRKKTLTFQLPTGGQAGDSVTQTVE